MARVRSLGVHEPSALDYLVREGHLKKDPLPKDYHWQTYTVHDLQEDDWVEEEILRTQRCVTWSRGGVIKRAYGVDVEGEKVLDAFVTSFAQEVSATNDVTEALPTMHQHGQQTQNSITSQPSGPTGAGYPPSDLHRALIVVLQTQLHIYFLSGDTHIVPLPFEVESALPAPTGIVLQRRFSKRVDAQGISSVPPNSFASPITVGKLQSFPSLTLSQASTPRPSLKFPDTTIRPPERDSHDAPGIFYLLDPRAEIGLVVAASNVSTRSGHYPSTCQALEDNETLLYLSTTDELGHDHTETRPLFLAVTSNTKTDTFTVWKVNYNVHSDTLGSARKRRRLDSNMLSRRRSSHVFGLETDAVTPMARGAVSMRESIGEFTTSFREKQDKEGPGDSKAPDLEELASQLGPEFGEVGVQTRAARRVSSMLARTDLATTQDRSTFNDIPGGHNQRTSFGRGFRRGESLGGFSDRTSFGPGKRTSMYGNNSILSQGSSFLDVPVDQLLQNLSDNGDIRGFEDMSIQNLNSNLPQEMIFTKVHEFPRSSGLQRTSVLERPHVFTMLSPGSSESTDSKAVDNVISICIVQQETQEIVVSSLQASYTSRHSVIAKNGRGDDPHSTSGRKHLLLNPMDIRRGSNIIDACKIESGPLSRMLLLTATRSGSSILNIEAPWGGSFRLDLPQQFRVHDPFSILPDTVPMRRRDGSLKRVISDPLDSFHGFSNVSSHGRVDLLDKEHKHHRIEITLQPSDIRAERILQVAGHVLKDRSGDGLLTTWWEVLRWMRSNSTRSDDEWTAIVVSLFCMAVPFIAEKQPRRPVESKRKRIGLRQTKQIHDDKDSWMSLQDHEIFSTAIEPRWMESASWGWTKGTQSLVETSTAGNDQPISKLSGPRSNSFLIECIQLARDFLQTPSGETAHGPEGYLPTAISRPLELRKTSLATLLVGLHLLREEEKLDTRTGCGSMARLKDLAPVLAQIGHWLGWDSWSWQNDAFYATEIADIGLWDFENTRISLLEVPVQPFEPPNVYSHVESLLRDDNTGPFLTLSQVTGQDHLTQAAVSQTRRLTTRLHLIDEMQKCFIPNNPYMRVAALSELQFTQELLASLPEGVSAMLYEAIAQSQSDPPTTWPESALKLVDRNDLLCNRSHSGPLTTMAKAPVLPHHEALRDYHAIGNMTFETEPYHFFDSSAEADRQFVTRLIYHQDRRLQDAAKLVNQLRPPVAECISEPDWTESDLLEAQKDLVQLVTLRTLAVSSGRGMMNFNSRIPLLTDKVPIPAFTLQCHMKPMNVTFSADRAAFTEEKVCWAFFHNGVSTGLTISKAAKGIDTSWILFNKPPELTNRHAGFLLGLGLNGHLKALAKWVAFKYLTPKHTMVSIGLLLGLSASYLGTMDTLITRLLSVHVTRMLPPGAAELNLSPLTQTAGIMGIGLLYANSQHRRMSEIMVSEIENTDVEESPQNILRDEGYRLAAGFALGLINLGKGRDLRGVHDMNIVERLLSLAIGTKNVNLVHVLDRTTAGATVATALIFLKTNNETIARKIDIPDTIHQFDYVRPDMFLLRTVARHLIMWSSVEATESWISRSLPQPYRNRASLKAVLRLSSEDMPFFNILAGLCLSLGLRYAGSASPQVRDLLVHYLDQFIRLTRLAAPNYDAKLTKNSVRNCQDVVALAVATVMAGTGDLEVFRRLRSLHGRIDPDTPYGSHLAAHMAIGALFLGGGTHTFSTSNLAVAALFCAFYPVFPTFVLDNKAHLQAFRHLWVLAAEPRCLIPREVTTHRPVNVPLTITLKSGTTGQLTAPCLLPPLSTISTIRILDSDYWTVTLDFNNDVSLPASFKTSQSVFLRRRSPYDSVSSSASSTFMSSLQAYADADPTPSVSAAASTTAITSARAMQQGSNSAGSGSNYAFEWLFDIASFKDLDVSEQALILPLATSGTTNVPGSSKVGLLKSTVVDTRLSLEKGILPNDSSTLLRVRGRRSVDKDRLWQLRLLFAWVERLDSEAGVQKDSNTQTNGMEQVNTSLLEERDHNNDSMWLRRQLIERLRWRVWKLANRVGDEEEEEEDEAYDVHANGV